MTRKDKKNITCVCCDSSLSSPQKLRQHYASNKNPCHLPLPEPIPEPPPNSEIEYLDALGLFDPPEIIEPIPTPQVEREYLKTLGILEPIPQFHQTDIISSGCELLDDHYSVEMGKE
ncbi:10611_t:CDS:1, partial [Diversispora eburnea]